MTYRLICGGALAGLEQLPNESVNCVVTSPPYFGLRDYGTVGQIGAERTPEEYVTNLVTVFREVRRVLATAGTLWLNLGDSYANVGKWGGSSGGKHVAELHGCTGIGRTKKDYGELKPKDLVGIPWMVAFALRADGWYLRSEIIWHKLNPMPESVSDRPTKSHEQMFLLAKSERYFYDADSIREPFSTDPAENYPARARITGRGNQLFAEARGNDRDKSGGFPPKSHKGSSFNTGKTAVHQLDRSSDREREDNPLGRNKRSVWTLPTKPYPDAHFATFPEDLITPCILAGCPESGTVLDPFAGSGTTGVVALRHNRSFIGIDLNPEYIAMARRRIHNAAPLLNQEATA